MDLLKRVKILTTGKRYDMLVLSEPVLIFDSMGKLLDHSPAARPLVQALKSEEPALSAFLEKIEDDNPIVEDRVVISQSPLKVYWLAGAIIDEGHCLVIGRDVSNDEKLVQALVASRGLHVDLLRCAITFGWETDETGAIVYIGPDKGMGRHGPDVAGEDAWTLFCPDDNDLGSVNPFVARELQEIKNVVMTSHSGEKRRMTVTSAPMLNDKGRWVGSRGVCRDVTDDYKATMSARHMSARSAIFSQVVAAMRTYVGAEELLGATAVAVADVLRADKTWVIRPDADSPIYRGADEQESLNQEVMSVCHKSKEWQTKTEGCRIVNIAGRAMQMLTVVGKNKLDGALIISRDSKQYPWRDYENALLKDIFEHLALALRQAALFEKLEYLSTIDELTNLYNRRAFSELVNKRIAAQRRNRSTGCLLYIDLDYFKEVNDTLGHAAGDAVLTFLGKTLNKAIRAEDLPGRMGGDEFAIWLEGTGIEGAKVKANEFIGLASELRKAAGDETLRLSMSIGIVLAEPDNEMPLDKLAAMADEALYAAKRAGKGTVVVA